MELSKYEEKEKYYIAIRQRFDEVCNMLHKAPMRQLDQPYQDGWILTIDLCDEAKARKNAPEMMEALNACKSDYITRDAKKISSVRKIKKFSDLHDLFVRSYTSTYGTYKYYVGPSISRLTEKKYNTLSLKTKKQFTLEVETTRTWGQVHTTNYYRIDVPNYYMVVKTKKRIVTRIQDIDPELVSEKEELNQILEPYWRTYPGKRRYEDELRKKVRRHTKDAIIKVSKGELEDVTNYNKLSKLKKT